MTVMLKRGESAAFAVVVLFGGFHASDCLAQRNVSADVSAGASFATNPFLSSGDETSGASAFVEVAPRISEESEISTFRLSGIFRIEPYARRYTTDAVAGIDLDLTRKQSERFAIRAGASANTNRSSALDALFSNRSLNTPGGAEAPQINDVTFIGQAARTTTIAVRAGATYRPGPRDMASVDISASAARFDTNNLAEYNFASQNFAYSRSVSERMWLSFMLAFSEVDYLRGEAGDGFSVTPMLGGEMQLSSGLKASLNVGLTYSRSRLPTGSMSETTAFAARGSLCNTGERTEICFNADRGVQPTALGGLRTMDNVSLSLSRQVGIKDRLRLSANYTRSGEGAGPTTIGAASFLGGTVDISRQISPRISVFGSATYADIYEDLVSRKANVQVRAGFRLRVGSTE
ncbi:hypothetical protein [Sphingomonas sp. M1-B02]|uniref:hypothetical protein n=1 Tax=Sphingomonas sp. M1-B02 TaxID=3114300 RepID=UPI00223F47FC|nr:hypothetical protein [Sphingomonas sp. S6-11]UZK67733.1 hypothetical protein OKW87_07865 [Sphingomonas sp. S6-11]